MNEDMRMTIKTRPGTHLGELLVMTARQTYSAHFPETEIPTFTLGPFIIRAVTDNQEAGTTEAEVQLMEPLQMIETE